MPTKIKDTELQIIDYRYDEGIRGRVEHDIVSTITTKASGFSGMPMIMKKNGGGNSMNKLRIRKLTPLECLKLQGFNEDDYNAIKDQFSDSAIYHVAGDSITTTILVAIFGELTNVDYRSTIQDYVATLKGDYNEDRT